MSFKELEVELAIQMHNAGLGVFQTANEDNRTIFVGEIPDSVEEGIVLIPVPSAAPHQYIDTEYAVIDFWARSPHTDRAKALLRAVNEFYFRRAHFDLGNWYVYFARVLGTIVDVDRDANGGKLFRLSIQFICRNLNHLS